MAVGDLKDAHDETFKAILCYNNKFAYYLRSFLAKAQTLYHNEVSQKVPHFDYYIALWEW